MAEKEDKRGEKILSFSPLKVRFIGYSIKNQSLPLDGLVGT